MDVGDAVKLGSEGVPWYSGYGGLPHTVLPVGLVGIVQTVDVPRVRGRGKGYTVARFEHGGRTWRISDIEATLVPVAQS